MCSRHRPIPVLAVLTLIWSSGWGQQPTQKVLDWPVNPYRNFFGSWTGQEKMGKSGQITPVTLKITEDKSHARMVWDYGFGVTGRKGYKAVRKYIVFSPADGKMLMNFEGEPQTLYDVPDLAAFTQAGVGSLIATETYKASNYWHVKRTVIAAVTFQLQTDTLSYRWNVTDRGDTNFYSEFNFTRMPEAAEKTTSP